MKLTVYTAFMVVEMQVSLLKTSVQCKTKMLLVHVSSGTVV